VVKFLIYLQKFAPNLEFLATNFAFKIYGEGTIDPFLPWRHSLERCITPVSRVCYKRRLVVRVCTQSAC